MKVQEIANKHASSALSFTQPHHQHLTQAPCRPEPTGEVAVPQSSTLAVSFSMVEKPDQAACEMNSSRVQTKWRSVYTAQTANPQHQLKSLATEVRARQRVCGLKGAANHLLQAKMHEQLATSSSKSVHGKK